MQIRDDLILIASADKNGGIGKNNTLLQRFEEDMRHFACHTTGHIIIVGRKTLESFPKGQPLPNRRHFVLSKNPDFSIAGVEVVHNLSDLLKAIESIRDKIYVCGGESVYKELLPFCNRAIITEIDDTFEADAYLPDILNNPEWICMKPGEWALSKKGIHYRIQEYERIPGKFI